VLNLRCSSPGATFVLALAVSLGALGSNQSQGQAAKPLYKYYITYDDANYQPIVRRQSRVTFDTYEQAQLAAREYKARHAVSNVRIEKREVANRPTGLGGTTWRLKNQYGTAVYRFYDNGTYRSKSNSESTGIWKQVNETTFVIKRDTGSGSRATFKLNGASGVLRFDDDASYNGSMTRLD
jgi:hypothetical protein